MKQGTQTNVLQRAKKCLLQEYNSNWLGVSGNLGPSSFRFQLLHPTLIKVSGAFFFHPLFQVTSFEFITHKIKGGRDGTTTMIKKKKNRRKASAAASAESDTIFLTSFTPIIGKFSPLI